jgi:hypothetical protein
MSLDSASVRQLSSAIVMGCGAPGRFISIRVEYVPGFSETAAHTAADAAIAIRPDARP